MINLMKKKTMSSERAANKKKQTGFTLLEVMIALLIVAMALPALVTLVMTQIDGAGHVRDKTYAMWIAENQLTRLQILNNKKLFPSYKLSEKDAGRVEMMGLQWQWQYEVSNDDTIPVAGIVKMDMDVSLLGPIEAVGSASAKDLKVDPLASIAEYLNE